MSTLEDKVEEALSPRCHLWSADAVSICGVTPASGAVSWDDLTCGTCLELYAKSGRHMCNCGVCVRLLSGPGLG